MKVTLESTEKIVHLRNPFAGPDAEVEARVWTGETESGVPVHCFITRISPRLHDPKALVQFDAELKECQPPSAEVRAIPLRLIL